MNSHKQFVKLGREKNRIQYKLLQLLPEIFKTEMYRKYCKTIEGYAWRFAQIPSSVVEKTLRLEKYLEDKPCLKAAVGEVGVHKVALVASIATAETDEIFADKVKNMSKPAMQELAKELRSKEFGGVKCCAVPTNIKIELDSEMTFLFLQLKKKYGGNNKEVMMRILQEANGKERKNFITKNGESKVATLAIGRPKEVGTKLSPGTTFVRYIRQFIRDKALQESKYRCSYPGCNKPPDANHHPDRFAKTGSHKKLKPLCKQHHEFMHNGLVENETEVTQNWKLKFDLHLNPTDQLYRKYRQRALI